MTNSMNKLQASTDSYVFRRRKNLENIQAKRDDARIWVSAFGAAAVWAALCFTACFLVLIYWPEIFTGRITLFLPSNFFVDLILLTEIATFLFGLMFLFLVLCLLYWRIRKRRLTKKLTRSRGH